MVLIVDSVGRRGASLDRRAATLEVFVPRLQVPGALRRAQFERRRMGGLGSFPASMVDVRVVAATVVAVCAVCVLCVWWSVV